MISFISTKNVHFYAVSMNTVDNNENHYYVVGTGCAFILLIYSPLECLMQQIKVGQIAQGTDCASHLLELQYFISRNYKLDTKLFKACHKDISVSLYHIPTGE